jgi:hypothetical protein
MHRRSSLAVKALVLEDSRAQAVPRPYADYGSETPHLHDLNHNNPEKDSVHYRVGSKKIHPDD